MTNLSDTLKSITGEDLGAMPDPVLAQWQAGWKPDSAQGILAGKEWDRRHAVRLMREQFQLDRRLMDANVAAMRFAAALSIGGTLAGAALGAYLTKVFA